MDALLSNNWKVRQDGEKEAKTYPMQNLGAEICKLAMIDLINKHHLPVTIQVHDELVIEVDEKDARELAYWLKDYMPIITTVKGVKFPVEVAIGKNWYECSLDESKVK
jgi:DNA polymerase I-like protein with 3'-5' exonuclease and polymerase domains